MSEEKKTLTQSITNAIKEGFNTLLNKQEEVQATPEKVEEVAEPKAEEQASFDAEDFVNNLKEVLAQFSKEVDAKIEAVKVEFNTQKETLEKENETLKAELSKEPEAKPIKTKGESVKFEAVNGSLIEFLNQNLK